MLNEYFTKEKAANYERELECLHSRLKDKKFGGLKQQQKLSQNKSDNCSFNFFGSINDNNSEARSGDNSFLFDKETTSNQNKKSKKDLITKRAASFRIIDEDTTTNNTTEFFQSHNDELSNRIYKRHKSFLDSQKIKINFSYDKSELKRLNERISSILPKCRAKEYQMSILVDICNRNLFTIKEKHWIIDYAIINTFIVFLLDSILGTNRTRLEIFFKNVKEKKFKCLNVNEMIHANFFEIINLLEKMCKNPNPNFIEIFDFCKKNISDNDLFIRSI